MIGLARLGRDAEVRYLQDGTPVANLALAFNYGRKDADGKRPTQWLDAALWGERAEKLSEYLLKGQRVMAIVEDVHIEFYDRNEGGQGAKLVGRVAQIEFAGDSGGGQQQGGQQRQQQQQRQAAPRTQQQSRAPAQQQRAPAGGGFDDMDDDIPF
ncbi:single-stranded DNA-binding protein [Caballeronia zhejiangensis]|uniref:Single-stranded DNA-binding protein n=2 Tax=Caballeronia zhejiangensis TaxID=871203 RepID=A0A656QCP4_9BURK|nr:single-stranded DNA-binding protein [Caballeronia zhejiangensis]